MAKINDIEHNGTQHVVEGISPTILTEADFNVI